jgi:hypothetical protein
MFIPHITWEEGATIAAWVCSIDNDLIKADIAACLLAL